MKRQYRSNSVRIIGGSFRRRLLRFPTIEGLRPTTDRMRETLFNWLMPTIRGATCLDLFAGSGALGVEAISRGAKQVVLVDESSLVLTHLRESLTTLGITNALLCKGRVPNHVALPDVKFNIIFVDPPFQRHLLDETLAWILQQNLLAPAGLVFLEQEKQADPVIIPAAFTVVRQIKAGNVIAYLLTVESC